MNHGFPGIPGLNIPDTLPEHIKLALDMSDLTQLAEEYEAMEASIAASEAGPSQPRKKRREINRGREEGDVGLFNDYFAETLVYHEGLFRRRYRMTRRLYNRIAVDITTEGMSVNWRYFTQRRDAACGYGMLSLVLPDQTMTSMKGYYLADGIYPAWSTLVKSFTYPPENNLKMRYFKRRQESARKDVERAFGVLQSRWGIIRGPSRSMDLPNIGDIMLAYIILHNMIMEDEGRDVLNWTPEDGTPPPPPYNHGAPQAFFHNLERFIELRARDQHTALRNDLVEHLWANKPVWDED
ncbi:hypothetical protein SSX86_024605 [Deinandra increscens subsp. villosa]|uniref:DDE Tnp4 domain-containing protein n=1 Tax=Deinandra increscens subsp. villosa TaxID=3103831 RepID=A0AAP0CBI2_9ASTR